MRKLLLATLVVQAFVGLALAHDKATTSSFDPAVQDLTNRGEPEILGAHWTREFSNSRQAKAGARPSTSPNMTYHGGKIMPTAVMQTIFWGPSWSNSTFAADKITGLDSWYTGHSNSNYAKTADEYTGTNGTVGPPLDLIRPPVDDVTNEVQNGGGGMPSFSNSIKGSDLSDLAGYVAHATGAGATR